jgi:hypothetical protein
MRVLPRLPGRAGERRMNIEYQDMNENQFWVAIWRVIGAVVVAVTISIGSCTANRHYQTRMLIENTGVDPIGAKCAIEGDTDNMSVCIQRAGRTP